jgi:hypothetical protein
VGVNVASITLGAAAALVSVVVAVSSALRAQYDRVLGVLDYLSSADVAQARHRLGLRIHRHSTSDDEEEVAARLADLFTVLWALGRVDAVRGSLPPASWLLHGPHELLRSSVRPWVTYWDRHIDKIATDLGADIEESRQGLNNLTDAWLK